jgi:hypothetical protein
MKQKDIKFEDSPSKVSKTLAPHPPKILGRGA